MSLPIGSNKRISADFDPKAQKEIDPALKSRNTYFLDGRRKIDFILTHTDVKYTVEGALTEDSRKHQKRRTNFELNLKQQGIQLEYQSAGESPDQTTSYVKLHATNRVLKDIAERLNIRVSVQEQTEEVGFFDRLGKCVSPLTSIFQPKIPQKFEVNNYFTTPYKLNKDDIFKATGYVPKPVQSWQSKQSEYQMFSDSQRTLIVNYILSTTPYVENSKPNSKIKIGINKLLARGSYDDAYPLHDGPVTTKKGNEPESYRQFLYSQWASPFSFYKLQPLDNIREYFGDQIAIYYAFLGLYTRWLLFAAIIGIIVFLYGLLTIFVPVLNPVKYDVCSADPVNFYMCPLCQGKCDFWFLKNSCVASWFYRLFDNDATILYSIFISFWCILFIESWKRENANLQYEWDLCNFKDVEQHVRPEYEVRLKQRFKNSSFSWYRNLIKKINPVTQEEEFNQPTGEYFVKIASSFSALLTIVVSVLGLVIGVIAYKIIVKSLLAIEFGKYTKRNNVPISPSVGSFIVSITAAILNLIFITGMGVVYKLLAHFLTEWELHRTESEHEDSYTLKMFLFQCINYYSSIFYIAFIKGKILVEYPGAPTGVVFLLEDCEIYGCLLDLCIQLSIIFLGKSIINNLVEIGVPLFLYIYKWFRSKYTHSSYNLRLNLNLNRWEEDKLLEKYKPHELFSEYLELVIQYGFVTLFVAAFPLAPLLAWINNIIEIRLDAYKMTVLSRRKVPIRAADIGVWLTFLDALAKVAVLSNAFLITFTGDTINQYIYSIVNPNNNTWLDNYVDFSYAQIPCLNLPNSGHFPDQEFQSITCSVAINIGISPNTTSCFTKFDGFENISLYQPFYRQDMECCAPAGNCPSTSIKNHTLTEPGNATCCSAIVDSMIYVNDTLISSFIVPDSFSSVADYCLVERWNTECYCRYRGDYGPNPYKPNNEYYYRSVTGKLVFVFLFENLIFLITGLLAWLIPDVPRSVKIKIRREQFLTNKLTHTILVSN